MDKSLDDIIKSKNIKLPSRNRSGLQTTGGGKPSRQLSVNMKSKLTTTSSNNIKNSSKLIRKPLNISTNNRIQKNIISDARQKINQKASNKNKIIDARSKIQIKDARLKLNKVQNNNSSRILKTKDLRGKLNLKTNKRKSIHVVESIQSIDYLPPRSIKQDFTYLNANLPLQRTISNNFVNYGGAMTRRGLGVDLLKPSYYSRGDMDYTDLDAPPPPPPPVSAIHHIEAPYGRSDGILYRSIGSSHLPPSHVTEYSYPSHMEVSSSRTIRNDLLMDTIPSHPHQPQVSSSRILSSHMKSRLDTEPLPPPRTMGILGQNRPVKSIRPPSPPSEQGYRIVVSNLKDSVNSDDIQELFEDIGPLVTSRVVRPGTAEVIYRNQKDAIKAVEIYHNRQLDRQPMKCMLVTPRASSNPLVPALPKLPTVTKTISVQPDIIAVHKALFNKPSQMYK